MTIMPGIKVSSPVIVPSKPKIESTVMAVLLSQLETSSQVIVHCNFSSRFPLDKIRIWKSTFLFAQDSDHISGLVSAENISFYPEWTYLEVGEQRQFTLIFTGLPKDCISFDFIEQIPEPGGFEFSNIRRNKTDVYYIDLTS